jgi:predicted dinucleotide-binding enzyme
MRIAVLGAGVVGQALAAKLRELGHDVSIGTRNPRDGATTAFGEQIQRAHPDAKVVNALNTVSNAVMVTPSLVPGEHVLFVCGNDGGAKAQVVELLGSFGWPSERIVDLGDITSARGTEMYIALWIRLMGTLDTPHFNITLPHA